MTVASLESDMTEPKPIPPRTLRRVEAYLTDAEIGQIESVLTPRESRSAFIAGACLAEVKRRAR